MTEVQARSLTGAEVEASKPSAKKVRMSWKTVIAAAMAMQPGEQRAIQPPEGMSLLSFQRCVAARLAMERARQLIGRYRTRQLKGYGVVVIEKLAEAEEKRFSLAPLSARE